MCIIVRKDKGAKIDLGMLKECFLSNSNGAGFMFDSDDGVQIYKGYMTFKAFKKAVRKYLNDDMEVVFHFRISTGRDTNEMNTHPFPLGLPIEQNKATHITCNGAMAHNGILHEFEEYDEYSDTQHFIQEVVNPLYERGVDLDVLEHLIGANKLCFMIHNKGTKWLGHMERDPGYKGYTFSNATYKPFKTTYYSDWELPKSYLQSYKSDTATYTKYTPSVSNEMYSLCDVDETCDVLGMLKIFDADCKVYVSDYYDTYKIVQSNGVTIYKDFRDVWGMSD